MATCVCGLSALDVMSVRGDLIWALVCVSDLESALRIVERGRTSEVGDRSLSSCDVLRDTRRVRRVQDPGLLHSQLLTVAVQSAHDGVICARDDAAVDLGRPVSVFRADSTTILVCPVISLACKCPSRRSQAIMLLEARTGDLRD